MLPSMYVNREKFLQIYYGRKTASWTPCRKRAAGPEDQSLGETSIQGPQHGPPWLSNQHTDLSDETSARDAESGTSVDRSNVVEKDNSTTWTPSGYTKPRYAPVRPTGRRRQLSVTCFRSFGNLDSVRNRAAEASAERSPPLSARGESSRLAE